MDKKYVGEKIDEAIKEMERECEETGELIPFDEIKRIVLSKL